MPQDTLHDYRPDPEFEIKSHLDDGVTKSYEDFAIPNSVLKAAGLLGNFHQQFYEDLKVNDSFYEPSVFKEAEADSPTVGEEAPKWSDLDIVDKRIIINPLTWDQLLEEAKTFFKNKNKPSGKPEELKSQEWHKDYAGFFPYIEMMYKILPDFAKIRAYFVGDTALVIEGVRKHLADPDIGRKIIWGFVAFRTAYINLMLKKLKEGNTVQIGEVRQIFDGLNITHKANGVEVGVEYNLILGGSDDAAAAFEMCQAFRNIWRAEMSVVFDANVYCREWMVVKDEALPPSAGDAEDSSLQIHVLDFIADVYSLVNIRRHTSEIEWAAFADAVKREVDVIGLKNPYHKDPDIIDIVAENSGGSEIPLFRRLELADKIHTAQYIRPLWGRLGDAFSDFEEAGIVKMLEYQGINMEKDAAGLERLIVYDKTKVARCSSLAYFELIGKQRDLEKAIKYSPEYEGSFTWRQNDKEGVLAAVEAPFNAEGMMTFIEKSSLLTSEVALFRNDVYNTQGSVWAIAGDVEGENPLTNVDLYHRLQSFNDQIAEAVKETRALLLELKLVKVMTEKPSPEESGQSVDDDDAEYKAAMEEALNKAKAEREETQKKLEELQAKLYDVKTELGGFLTRKEIQREMDSIRTQGYSNRDDADPPEKRRYGRMGELRGMGGKKERLARKRKRLEERLPPLEEKFEEAKKKEYEAQQKYNEVSQEKVAQVDDSVSVSGLDDFQATLLPVDELLIGFYRPAIYDLRLENQLKEITAMLAEDKAVAARIDIYGHLFPDSSSPDQDSIDVLKGEKAVAKAIDTFVNTLLKIRREIDEYEKITIEEKLTKVKETAKTAAEALVVYKEYESRRAAEVKYGIKALQDAKYSEAPLYNEDEDIWNLRRLIRYVLWHAAVVNKELRKILSRGPAQALLHNFGLEEPDAPERDEDTEEQEEPEEIKEDGLLLQQFLEARRNKDGNQTIVDRELMLRAGSKRRLAVGGLSGDFILVDGDLACFVASFGRAVVAVQPGALRGSGSEKIDGKRICLEGDEKITVTGCSYITGGHTISGVGTVTVKALAANHTAQKTKIDGKSVLLKGAQFTAEFEVQTPAKQMSPSGLISDPTHSYTGTGYFINTNATVQGA